MNAINIREISIKAQIIRMEQLVDIASKNGMHFCDTPEQMELFQETIDHFTKNGFFAVSTCISWYQKKWDK